MDNYFCSKCGCNMEPVFYRDYGEDFQFIDKAPYDKTYIVRCSHLLCENCGNTEVVDNSFDEGYYC